MAMRATAILKKVVRSVADPDTCGVNDCELLRRFAGDNDQAAFETLVRRHTGLVLGVCRRTLSNPQDAEDACQATFLILAKKANSERWQSSVANWLYTAARRVARNALVSAQRRRKQERRAAVSATVPAVDAMSGRELMAILDDELEKLPSRYRESLVLCCLEGLARDEAAARLGIPTGTVKIRLERGRKRLADALTSRGCILGSSLLALAVTSAAEASPSRLINAILATASGSPPAAVAALAKGVIVNGSAFHKWTLAALFVIGATVVGIGFGTVSPTTAGQLPDKAPPAKPIPESPKETTVSGQVLDPNGKPQAGVKLLLIGAGDRAVELGATKDDGRFTVPLPKVWKGGYLIARAEGFGIDFVLLSEATPSNAVELHTVAEQVIHGRLVDTEGKPVAGASVRIARLGTSASNSLVPILAEWKKLNGFSASPVGEKYIWSGTPSLWNAMTDKDGRFEFRGVGAERLAMLRLVGSGVTEAEVYVANRKDFDPKEYNDAVVKNSRDGIGAGKPRWNLFGPKCSVVVEREKPIRGRISLAGTDKPRVGVQVTLSRNGSDLMSIPLFGSTDKDGHFEFHGAHKSGRYMVEVESDPKEGYMACQAWGEDTSGYDPVTINFNVKKGVIVTGRMLDKATGKPVPGYIVIGVPEGNPSVKDYPTFNSSGWLGATPTAADGTFRVVTIPGPVLLMGGPNTLEEQGRYKRPAADPKYPQFFHIFGDHTAYRMPGGAISPLQGSSCKVIEIKADAKTVEHDLILEPANAK